METLTDATLLERLRAEDTTSFALLYTYYFPTVAAYVQQNSGSRTDAEDLFQEAIVVLLQKVRQPNFEFTSSLKTYLYAIARHLWLKRLRNQRLVFLEEVPSYALETPTEPWTCQEPLEKSTEEKVQIWLQKITQHCQRLLKALFFYQQPMTELMETMGWKNRHTADNQKYKCIQQMKKEKEKGA
jgi:RNA polymerase sigma factor (sigma-70 family)